MSLSPPATSARARVAGGTAQPGHPGLQSIVGNAVAILAGARWAGISLITARRVIPRAPSDPLVAELDELQSSLDEGPCLDALRGHRTVHIGDMTTESRWPRFTAAAVEPGARSSLSFQLLVNSQNLGALNLYGGEPGAFDEDSTSSANSSPCTLPWR